MPESHKSCQGRTRHSLTESDQSQVFTQYLSRNVCSRSLDSWDQKSIYLYISELKNDRFAEIDRVCLPQNVVVKVEELEYIHKGTYTSLGNADENSGTIQRNLQMPNT